jgi:hypothetical protein
VTEPRVADAHPPAETWRKIGAKSGDRVVLLGAPRTWRATPEDARVLRRRGGPPADVVVAFYGSRAGLEHDALALGDAIAPDGMVWVAWPRKVAGHVSDLSDEVVRAALLPHGLVDVKVARLDEDWSGLKFVWRRERRAARR